MNPRSERVKRWRYNTKQRLIDAFGGKCGICGYDQCPDVFEFHHLKAEEKDFHWGQINGNIRGWDTIVNEIRKCVMLCSNCHREVHSKRSTTTVPDDIIRFNEEYADYRKAKVVQLDPCAVCGVDKKISLQFCSHACAKVARRKVDWDNIDLDQLIKDHGSFEAVGRHLGVSGNAVRRRLR